VGSDSALLPAHFPVAASGTTLFLLHWLGEMTTEHSPGNPKAIDVFWPGGCESYKGHHQAALCCPRPRA